jgi:anaerobic selenocysteine-containing dehydrogenase
MHNARMREPKLNTSPSPGDEVKTTTCYMCACRCGIKVWLADGGPQGKVIRYIQGNPAHPVNKGVLCAKGSAGIMQHYSPARLSKPLLRVGERGSGEFREIEWDEALQLATSWLAPIRERNPDELAFFTGRDQSQALTGWWAQQFGTINYAAHGGFCSVNMAAGGLLHARRFVLGVRRTRLGPHAVSDAVGRGRGPRLQSDQARARQAEGARGEDRRVNPVRSGYGAIADEWIGIRPGTDGLFAFALIHELLRSDRIDLDYLVRYANAHWLVVRNPGGADDGLFARDADGMRLCWDRGRNAAIDANAIDLSPVVIGEFTLADGRVAVPVFQLLAERYLDPQYSARRSPAKRCGIPADTIRRIARELAAAAFDSKLSLPTRVDRQLGSASTEKWSAGRWRCTRCAASARTATASIPVRALHVLQAACWARSMHPVRSATSRHSRNPFRRRTAPARPAGRRHARCRPARFRALAPRTLVVDADGQPRRIDHAFSWAYPLAAHGMLHTGDPQRLGRRSVQDRHAA